MVNGTLNNSTDALRLVFFDAIGKGGGVAAKAFDNGRSPLYTTYVAHF